MRISEVLKLTPSDINNRRLTLREPKSGREQEFIFIPQRLADSFKNYIREKGIQPNQRFSLYVMRLGGKWLPKRVVWWVFISGHMI